MKSVLIICLNGCLFDYKNNVISQLNFKASYLANKFITNTGFLLMLGGENAFNKIEKSSC